MFRKVKGEGLSALRIVMNEEERGEGKLENTRDFSFVYRRMLERRKKLEKGR